MYHFTYVQTFKQNYLKIMKNEFYITMANGIDAAVPQFQIERNLLILFLELLI